MTTARPLRDVFGDLAGDAAAGSPGDILAASGHGDLPDDLVAEAIVNFADTAPAEIAEHLAPYVMAHSPVPFDAGGTPLEADPGQWFGLLASAPPVELDADPGTLDVADGHPDPGTGHDAGPGYDAADAALDLDFGYGDAAPAHSPVVERDGALSDVWDADPAAHLDTLGSDPAAGVDSGLFTVDSEDAEDADADPGADDGDAD